MLDRHRSYARLEGADDFLKSVVRGRGRKHLVLLEQIDQPLVGGNSLICGQPALFKLGALREYEGTPLVPATLAAAQAEAIGIRRFGQLDRRIAELGQRKSLLNPLWYAGALAFGVAAGRFGDRWNLGFLAETERQVESHLTGHLERLPPTDRKSRAIVEQMKADEIEHAETAVRLGAHALPAPVRGAMKLASKVMTTLAYRV